MWKGAKKMPKRKSEKPRIDCCIDTLNSLTTCITPAVYAVAEKRLYEMSALASSFRCQ